MSDLSAQPPVAEPSATDAAPGLLPKNTVSLVNTVALKNCTVRCGDGVATVLDISHVRVVIEAVEPWLSLAENEVLQTEFLLDRYRFGAAVVLRGKGSRDASDQPATLRLGFERILPSARSHLRGFLSPKKVGESILEDRRTDNWRHYHGLNEAELWFDPDGGILFTYLDPMEADAHHSVQFVVQLTDHRGPLRVGKMPREEYIALTAIDGDLPLAPLTDRDAYAKLGECRDIVTNFRPAHPAEYGLKQRLLRAISETLYSTSHKVDMASSRSSSSSSSASSPPPNTDS